MYVEARSGLLGSKEDRSIAIVLNLEVHNESIIMRKGLAGCRMVFKVVKLGCSVS